MLTEEEFEDLPREPELAFVKLVDLLNWKLARAEENEWINAAHEYVQMVSAFADVHQIPLQIDRTYPRDSNGFHDWFMQFKNAAVYAQSRFRFVMLSGVPAGVVTVKLNNQYRDEIHDLLSRVRKVVANLQISESKREAIYAKIAALELEVDKERTRLDTMMDLMLATSEKVGEAAENLEPVVKILERVKGIFAQAKAESDPPALPRPESDGVAKRLTGPAVAADEPEPSGGFYDDTPEIPF